MPSNAAASADRPGIGLELAEIRTAFRFRQGFVGPAIGAIVRAVTGPPHERYTARNALPASIGPSLHRFPRTVSPGFGAKKTTSHVSARL
jgi:hypothetical protein